MKCIAGIDISKSHLDVCIGDGPIRQFDADHAGRMDLVRLLFEAGISTVVVEATGGLERPLLLDLQASGLDARCINPRRVRQFAQAAGRLAKTDAIDARVLREYGMTMKLPAPPQISERRIRLQELLARRDQLMAARTAEMNRRQQVLDSDVQSSIDACLDVLNNQVEQIEVMLTQLIEGDAVQAGLGRVLNDVKGVGPQTINAMLIRMPELGFVSRTKIAALAGVAPMNNDSGSLRGKRTIKGGRGEVRRVLYMAAVVSIRHNDRIRPYFEGLRARGKTFKVAIVACMRKLLVYLNALAREYYACLVTTVDPAASPPS